MKPKTFLTGIVLFMLGTGLAIGQERLTDHEIEAAEINTSSTVQSMAAMDTKPFIIRGTLMVETFIGTGDLLRCDLIYTLPDSSEKRAIVTVATNSSLGKKLKETMSHGLDIDVVLMVRFKTIPEMAASAKKWYNVDIYKNLSYHVNRYRGWVLLHKFLAIDTYVYP